MTLKCESDLAWLSRSCLCAIFTFFFQGDPLDQLRADLFSAFLLWA